MIPKEDCIVVVTKDGYVKRVSKRSFASTDDSTGLKEMDYVIGMYEVNTLSTILMFTDLGNYLFVPVHIITESKWKDLGKHVNNFVMMSENEYVISSCINACLYLSVDLLYTNKKDKRKIPVAHSVTMAVITNGLFVFFCINPRPSQN